MDKLTVNVSKPYDVVIGSGILKNIRELSKSVLDGRRALVVSGSNVAPLYASSVAEMLDAPMFVYESGEKNKNFATLEKIVEFMAQNGLGRDDCVVAVGGGVTGDIAAMAASIYMRGINLIQIPTTLLSAVDSSIGGKTAVNITCGKNLAGTFYQPSLVIVDTDCLSTLPYRIYTEGMAEVIKYSYISGQDLSSDKDMIYKCLDIKRKLVEEDEFDRSSRMILNFGHTLGHAIETLSDFSYLHGEAVAVGMAYMCKAYADDYELMERMLLAYGLPVSTEIPSDKILEKALLDKKGGLWIVPHSFGDVRVEKPDLCKLT